MSGGWRAPVTPHPATTVGGGIGSVLKGMQLSASLWHSLCVGQVLHTQRLPYPARPLLAGCPSLTPCRLGSLLCRADVSFSLHTSACSPKSRTPSTRLGVSLAIRSMSGGAVRLPPTPLEWEPRGSKGRGSGSPTFVAVALFRGMPFPSPSFPARHVGKVQGVEEHRAGPVARHVCKHIAALAARTHHQHEVEVRPGLAVRDA